MITSVLSNDIAYAIAWTLIHSLWQISLVSILLAFVLKVNNKAKSTHRYFIGLGALGVSILMALVTFTSYYMNTNGVEESIIEMITSSSIYALDNISQEPAGFLSIIETYIPVIVNIWILGVSFFLIKLLGGFIYIKKLVGESNLQNHQLSTIVDNLNKNFHINRLIQIKESFKIDTPMVMGYFKPVILFPLGLVNHLNVSEVEAILAHEMAHIKRHDFIFNFIQMLAESIFYYHPGIWYISSRINAERENCCDDMAIDFTANNISYAKTLVKLQELKASGSYAPAMAFSGNKKHFTQRIMRLLNQTTTGNQYRDKFIAIALIFMSLVLGANNWESKDQTVSEAANIYFIDDCPADETQIFNYLDTIPEKNNFHIKKITNEKELEMEMKNGEVVKLIVDGIEVDKENYKKHKELIEELSPDEDHELITIFPNCHDEMGFIYMIDGKNGLQIRLDSMLGEMELKELEELRNSFITRVLFHDMEQNKRYEYEVLREFISDSLKNHLKDIERETAYVVRQNMALDSVWKLFPEKFPNIIIKDGINGESEDMIIELENDIVIDLKDHENKMIFKMEKAEKEREEAMRNYEIQMHKLGKDLERKNFEYFYKEKPKDHQFYEFRTELLPHKEFRSGNVSDHLCQHLLKDQLIESDEKTKIELSHKHLKINGDKQPKNIFKKYLKIYEDFTGIQMTKGSKLKFDLDPKKSNSNQSKFFYKRHI